MYTKGAGDAFGGALCHGLPYEHEVLELMERSLRNRRPVRIEEVESS